MNFERKEYSEKLKRSFPKYLEKNVENVVKILPLSNSMLIHSSEYEVNLNTEKLIIPYRVYFDEPLKIDERILTKVEKEILNCIFLRHNDGYLRERRLQKLLKSNSDFVIPFTFQLLGEYVFEILEVLDKHLKEPNLNLYKSFFEENLEYGQKTKDRMISYWDAYHRKGIRAYPKIKDYLGYRLMKRIKGK